MSGSSNPFAQFTPGSGDSAIAAPPPAAPVGPQPLTSTGAPANPFAQFTPGSGDSAIAGPATPPTGGFDQSLDQSQVAAQANAPTGAGTPDNPIVLQPVRVGYHQAPAGQTPPPGPPISGTETVPADVPVPSTPGDNAQPQPDTLAYLEHLGGLGVRAGVEGITGTVTQPLSLGAQGADYLTGSKALQPLASLPQTVDQNLTQAGVAVPQGPIERIGTAAASAVPGALAFGGLGSLLANSSTLARLAPQIATLGRALAAAPTTLAASGAAGAGASQAATEAGAGPLVSTLVGLGAGGLTPHIGSALADNAARLTNAGQQRLAGQLYVSKMSNPAQTVQGLQAPAPAGLSSVPTAEATGDLGLASFEQGVRSDAGAKPGFGMIDANRAAARAQIMQSLQQAGTSEERGQTIRSVLSDDITPAIKSRVSQLYTDAKPGVAPVVLDPIRQKISTMLGSDGMFGPGSGGPQGPLRGAMRELAQRHTGDGTYLQNMRGRLGNIASVASRAGDNRTAAAAGQLRDSIDELSGSPEWSAAQHARREQGLALGKDEHGANATGHILKPDKFGVPGVEDGKVAGRAIRDAASTRQVLRAADTALRAARSSGQDTTQLAARIEQMRAAMRGEFAAKLFDSAQTETGALDAHGHAIPNMTGHKFLRAFHSGTDVAKQLFSAEDFQRLSRVAHDFDAEEIATKARGAGQNNSITGHAMSTAEFLRGVATGHIPGTSRLATRARQTLGLLASMGSAVGASALGEHFGIGEVAGAVVFGHHGAATVQRAIAGLGGHGIKQALVEAAQDPNVARALVARVSPRTLNRIADGPHRSRLATIAAASIWVGAPQLAHQQYEPN